jgi:acylphosphatase
MMSEVVCVVSGDVQRVGFRDFVQTKAMEFGCTGFVVVLAQGIPDTLKALIEELHEGSVLAAVTGVSVDWQTPKELFSDFVVVY